MQIGAAQLQTLLRPHPLSGPATWRIGNPLSAISFTHTTPLNPIGQLRSDEQDLRWRNCWHPRREAQGLRFIPPTRLSFYCCIPTIDDVPSEVHLFDAPVV